MGTMSLARVLVTSLSLLGAVTACAADDDASSGTSSDAGADSLSVSLADRSFLLQNSSGYEPVVNTDIRVSFADGRFTFNGGCNSCSGSFTIEDDALLIDSMGCTLIACSTELANQEEWLRAFFTAEPALTLDGDTLAFASGGVTLTFLDRTVADPDRPLAGPTWTIDTLMTGSTASSIPSSLTNPTVFFGDDGSFTVETDCSTGAGTYSSTTTELTFSSVTFTESTCSNSEAATVLVVLTSVFADGTSTYDIDATRLTVERDDVGIAAAAAE